MGKLGPVCRKVCEMRWCNSDLNVCVSVSKKGVICVKVCNHINGEMSSEEHSEIGDREVVAGRGLVEGGDYDGAC